MTFDAEDNLKTHIVNAHSNPKVEVSPTKRSYSHVTGSQEPSQIQFGRRNQAQVVIKATQLPISMFFIIETINYYFIYIQVLCMGMVHLLRVQKNV